MGVQFLYRAPIPGLHSIPSAGYFRRAGYGGGRVLPDLYTDKHGQARSQRHSPGKAGARVSGRSSSS